MSLVGHCLDLASSLSDGEPVQGLELWRGKITKGCGESYKTFTG